MKLRYRKKRRRENAAGSVVTQFGAVRTYVLTDIIECQEVIPDITINCIKLSHYRSAYYLEFNEDTL